MIKVNLQGEKRDYRIDYVTHGAVLATSFFAFFLLFGVLQISASSKMSKLAKMKKRLTNEDTRLSKITKEVEGLDIKRKWLVNKLTTIARLKAVKQEPVKVLDALTTSIPEKSWIETVVKRGESIEFTGVALDNQTVSLLMRQLENSDFFDKVDLVFSKQLLQNEVPLKQFSLSASLTDPLRDFKKIDGSKDKDKKSKKKSKKKK